jgi:hypothetical protein
MFGVQWVQSSAMAGQCQHHSYQRTNAIVKSTLSVRTQKSKSPALGQGPVPPKRQQILGKAKKLVHACPETAIGMGSTHLNRKC